MHLFLRVHRRARLPFLVLEHLLIDIIVAVLIFIDVHVFPRSTLQPFLLDILQAIPTYVGGHPSCRELWKREERSLSVPTVAISLELHREDAFLCGSHLSNFIAVKADFGHHSFDLIYFWNSV